VQNGQRQGLGAISRLRRAGTGAAALLLVLTGTALADTANLSVLTTTGESDPVADVPRIFRLAGTTSVPKRVYVKTRAPGGAPCAPSAASDSGSRIYADPVSFYGESVNGTFTLQGVKTWPEAGEAMFCIWLSDGDSSTIATPITQTIAFRGPSGTISATVAPGSPAPQQRTTITITGSSETPAVAYAKLRRAGGAGCAPSASSDSGQYLGYDGRAVNGAFSFTVDTSQSAGTYLACLWLAESSSDANPIAGPQSVTFTVTAPPPPPCLVPRLGTDRRGATVKAQLRAAHCRAGSRKRVYSRWPKGSVIRLAPRAGTQLPSGARVRLTISKGRRPHLHRG
jgi:hypothetical protein